ncbi:unclassified [Brachyspira pilosicoli WesB]|uniref:Unclassified n=1 Tax=Brachyspira pilosicoli WesB TaxID=1161918 RepID=K0JFB6_BRAPL|nr:winged helix-turn-helix domain-containing protein [Brachyspira pilosicoli]CCG56168.1 unclassified [Brachyspira pilosicoli WesB]
MKKNSKSTIENNQIQHSSIINNTLVEKNNSNIKNLNEFDVDVCKKEIYEERGNYKKYKIIHENKNIVTTCTIKQHGNAKSMECTSYEKNDNRDLMNDDIKQMYKDKRTQKEIADITGISQSTVSRRLKEVNK